MTVWIPRPLTAALRTKELFEKCGVATHVDPAIECISLPASRPTMALYDAIVATSPTSIERISGLNTERTIPIYCAGEASAQLAAMQGFTKIHTSQPPGGKDIACQIQMSAYKRVLYLHGDKICFDVEQHLPDSIQVDRLCLYKTIARKTLDRLTVQLIKAGTIRAVLLFSNFTARTVITLLKQEGLEQFPLTALVLSEGIAETAKKYPWHDVHVGTSSEALSCIAKALYD